MNLPKIDLHEAVAALLARGKLLGAVQSAAATGKTQSSNLLAIKTLGKRVHRMRAARSTHYAPKKDILGLAVEQPMVFTDASGSVQDWGLLTHVHTSCVFTKTPLGGSFGPTARLPWFLTPLCPQEFLGRQYAQLRQDVPPDPDQWSLA